MLTLLLLLSFLAKCSARAVNDVAAQPRNMGRDPQYKRVCYYTNWSQYRKQPARFFPFNIDPFLCTHLIFAFAKVDYKGQLAPYEWNDIQYPHLYKQFTGLKKKNPHLKTLLAVGGWTHGSRPFTDMVKTKVGRKSFIDQSVQYLRAHNFDGLDLDWEYPANRGSPEEDKKKFSLLVMELREAYVEEAERTGKERLLVTAAVGGGEKIVRSAYEVPVINKYLDFINLMSYDLHGSWSKVIGINAPLYASSSPDPKAKTISVDEVVQLWLDLGATADKLVMGIPTYGRSFTLCSEKQIGIGDKNCGPGSPAPYTRERGFVSYYEMSENLKQGWTRVWLDDQMVPYAYNLRNKQWVGYDDVQSVQLKAQYIKHRNLAGAMVWAVDLDDFANLAKQGEVYPLCKAIREVLEDADYPAFTPPPKLAKSEERPMKTKPDKEAYKKEKDVTKKDRSSKFDSMKTVKKSPFLPPSKKSNRPMTSPLMSSKTQRTTSRATAKPKSSTTKKTTQPKRVTTMSSRLRPTSTPRPTIRRTTRPSRGSPNQRSTSTRHPSIWQRKPRPTKHSTVSRKTHRVIPTTPKFDREIKPTKSTTIELTVSTPNYLRSNPTNPIPITNKGRTTPTLPPVLTSSSKYPQWEPVVITTRDVDPTDFVMLKKSSKDLRKSDIKNTPLSRKLSKEKKQLKKPVGVDQFGPKPTPRRSPYTPPPHLRKRPSTKKVEASHVKTKPKYRFNPRFPPKKVNDGFYSHMKKTKAPNTQATMVSTSASTRHTTTSSTRRVTRPRRLNVIRKPKHEAFDSESIYDTMDATSIPLTTTQSFKALTKAVETTPVPTATTVTSRSMHPSTKRTQKWRPPYSFKPWAKTTRRARVTLTKTTPVTTPLTVTTTATTTSTTQSTETVPTTIPSSLSTTIPTRKSRPRYSFKPWSRTTRRTTPAITTISKIFKTETASSTTPATTPSTTTTKTTTPAATIIVTTLSTKTPKQNWKPRYSFKPWPKTTRKTTTTVTSPGTTETTTKTTMTTTFPITRKWRPPYSFKPSTDSTIRTTSTWRSSTLFDVTKVKEAVFKPRLRALTRATHSPTKTTTSLPAFRPWTKASKKSTTVPTVSSTKAFFLFAKLTSSTPASKVTTSTNQRITPRVRNTQRSKQYTRISTPSNVVNIVKEKTFPVKKTIEATTVTNSTTQRHTTTTRGKETGLLSTTPDLRARADGKFVAATWTTNVKTSTTSLPTTSVKLVKVNLKKNEKSQDSDYRKRQTNKTTSRSKATFVRSTSPKGPQKIFAWMTPITNSRSTAQTKTTSLTTPTSTKRRTLPTIQTVTRTPTTAKIVKTPRKQRTSTTTPSTTTITTAVLPMKSTTIPKVTTVSSTTQNRTSKLMTTHSIMEAGLGLDHTHASVKLSPLRKGIYPGFVRTRQGIRFAHRPLPRVTPPPVATLPTRTERPYVMTIPKTNDCDHKEDDTRYPDSPRPVKTQNRQEYVRNKFRQGHVRMNTDYVPPRQKSSFRKKKPQQGYVIQNLKDNIHTGYDDSKERYSGQTRLTAWPKQLIQPNIRYHLPPRKVIQPEPRPQVGYNIPLKSEEHPQTIVVDYKLPGGKFNTVEQTVESKSQDRTGRVETRNKENNRNTGVQEFRCPSVFGIFPDRTDCRKFYQCVWFVPFHHMCGKGTVWNDVMKICDWPQSVSSCLT